MYPRSELHNHSEVSNIRLIDCINKVEKLIDRAVELKLNGIAITDHEFVGGHVKAIKHVKEGKKLGTIPKDFKLILGNEVYLTNEDPLTLKENYHPGDSYKFFHFILLAKDEIGHKQLRRLSSLAWDNSFYTGLMERTPLWKEYLEQEIGKDPGHLIGSTACLGGELDYLILKMNEAEDDKDYYKEQIENLILYFKNLFGDGNFYLEMQPAKTEEQRIVNYWIPILAKVYNVKYIITCDSHYLSKDQQIIHEAYLKSHEEEREVADFYATTYLMEEEEIFDYLDYMDRNVIITAFNNSVEITNQIEDYDLFHPTIVPEADIPEFEIKHLFKDWYDLYPSIKEYAYSDNIFDKYLLYLIEEGYIEKVLEGHERTPKTTEEKLARINIELDEMKKVTDKINTSISSYYISTLELINIMWNEGNSLVGIARGSVTGMYTMYLIGVIQMNPLDWNLPHWRHISHQKAELSDVDIDSEASKRGQIIEAVKAAKGERRVLNACTFKTEGSKSAIITACRSLDVSPDISASIANLIPIVRGKSWTLSECLYGNAKDGKEPIKEFINEVNAIPQLKEVALGIEGLICGRSIHASAVYIFNDDFTEHNARCKAPNGTFITQFNMKDSDYCSGLKMDFLTIESLDRIRKCMEWLIEKGYMEWKGTLRDTYNCYLHPDKLDYDTKEMWDMVSEGTVVDLFQFQTQIGIQAAKKIKPHSLPELAAASSVMRLMVTDPEAEQPLDTYIKYKENIQEWYDLMTNKYHLTEEEIAVVEPYLKSTYGVGDTQEIVMQLAMDEHIANFSVADANKLRKGIAKKDAKLQEEMHKFFFERGLSIGTSYNLLQYIWVEVIGKQLGYSFSLNHTFPYSGIGLQELNMAYHFPIIYWNVACLTVNAGADSESVKKKSTEYGKVASAIGDMQHRGIKISLPTINEAGFGFLPNEEENLIIFSLKGLVGIGDDVVNLLIENRPYASLEDFYTRMIDTGLVKGNQMLQLIKAGCFTKIHSEDRIKTLKDYISRYKFSHISRLTRSQLNKLQYFLINYEDKFDLPKEVEESIILYNYRKYVLSKDNFYNVYVDPEKNKIPKCGYHDELYLIPEQDTTYFDHEIDRDALAENGIIKDELIFDIHNYGYVVKKKDFVKATDILLKPLDEYLQNEAVIESYNECTYNECAKDIITGTISHMEMESLCLYTGEHELANVDAKLYSVENYFEMDIQPTIQGSYNKLVTVTDDTGKKIKKNKTFYKYRITRIMGTVIDKNKDKHLVTLLTPDGVVNVKYNKGQFNHYNKRLSDNEGIIEESWFKRGTLLFITGYRQDDQFRCYNYVNTIFTHTTNKIIEINDDGTVEVQCERERR